MKPASEQVKASLRQAPQAAGVCLLLVLAVLAVFGQAAHFDFVNYDDDGNVYENPIVEKGLSATSVGWAFTHAQNGNWIPLTTLSHMLDCQLFGLRAGRHHLVNVLCHAVTAVLLFLVLRQMTGSLWRCAAVAALFAVHPLRAESVAWVSERKDVLSGLFFILTIGAYVRQTRKPSRTGYVVMLFLFALGLLGKTMVATLPFVLLLLDYWPLGRLRDGRQFLRLAAEKTPFFALAAAACVAAALVPGFVLAGAGRLSFWNRLANALVSYVVYLRQMVFPVRLVTPYPLLSNGPPLWEAALAFLLLAAITAAAMAQRKKHPCLLVGWLWYLGMLVPVIGLVQISDDTAHADRYTYLPQIGLALAGTWALGEWSQVWKHRRVVLGALSMAVITVLTIRGHAQASYWKNSETLWNHTLACDPYNTIAYYSLGLALARKGEGERAIGEFRKALEINPRYAQAYRSLGDILSEKGEKKQAIAEYQKALAISPNYVAALNNLGTALANEGQSGEAIAQFRRALQINPGLKTARFDLAVALADEGKTEEALAEYRKALELYPDYARAHLNLGLLLDQCGRAAEATVHLRKALEINPRLAGARESLGKVLLRNGDFAGGIACFAKTAALDSDAEPLPRWLKLGGALSRNGDLAEAIICYQQAIRIDPRSPDAYANLGLASFRQGKSKEAADAWQQALAIKPDQPPIENNLAWLLATTPDASVRNGPKAVALAEQANQTTGGANAFVLHTLAAAYAATGRYGEAAAIARRALELAAAQKNDDLAARLPKEIKLYETNQPLRDLPQ